jgi:hypothetical protein
VPSAADWKSAAVKMAAARLADVERQRVSESGKRVELAQMLTERDDRNVRKTRRKETRRSWYKIPPWVILKVN